jgi:hypothetical protein
MLKHMPFVDLVTVRATARFVLTKLRSGCKTELEKRLDREQSISIDIVALAMLRCHRHAIGYHSLTTGLAVLFPDTTGRAWLPVHRLE